MRRTNTLLKVIAVLFLAAIICYISFHLIDRRTSTLKSAPAVACTVENGGAASGIAVRNETVLTSQGYAACTVSDGEHISAGQTIAVQYSDRDSVVLSDELRSLNARIALLSSGSDNTPAPDSDTRALAGAVARGDLSELAYLADCARASVFDSGYGDRAQELSALSARASALSSRASAGRDIAAEMSGTFSSHVDGYEGITPEKLGELTPSLLGSMRSENAGVSSGAYGKIVSGTTWYFASVMAEEDAQRLAAGETAHIRFTKTLNAEMDMTVVSVGASADGKRVVIFSSDHALEETSSVRELTGEVIFSSETGLLVPKEAVHEDDGTYLYILAGYQVKRIDITVVCDYDEDYALIRPDEGYSLGANAQIVTSDSELFDGKVVR